MISLDYNNMLSSRLGGRGIDPARLEAMAGRFRDAHADTVGRRDSGEMGFFALPDGGETVSEIQRFAEGAGQAFSNLVVLGIGGSALGTTALRTALLHPLWNELDDEAREFFPRLHVLDNVDPATFGAFLDHVDLRRTLFNVVSKSGGTAETMSQYLIIRERLQAELGDGYRRHLLFTTDPEKGVLRALAREEEIATLPVPSNVGGRFSVLSAVGLLPAAMAGIDVAALLEGAREMAKRCESDDLRTNPAGMFAALQYLADTEHGAPIHVMMPYSDRLRDVADWFRQLWAESLGKQNTRGGAEVFAGPTPVKSLGATDQHSQVQLYMEGPFDKTITFLAERDFEKDVQIPSAYPHHAELAYLGGHSMGELLRTEMLATEAALAQRGRMNMTIEVPRVDAHAIGGLFMMLQIATVYAGHFYGVDPLDQPGVELGKQLTYGIMGRPGFEERRAEWEGRAAKDDAFVLR
ncbi:MAG: Glucose-6-phosphate isomerase [uncultured Gemmatimonadetes bacterium]|uniref:Glucose-6-phosphate isomerase n=1 Tax=uncultured Gemmatimonadota bacterium TaxID=203437 RepID=A0A6J4KF82_9BACT|nr:MAG: Glucose-6-phosphate isomerase [uncultured Gemmatimonadota bacterium]